MICWFTSWQRNFRTGPWRTMSGNCFSSWAPPTSRYTLTHFNASQGATGGDVWLDSLLFRPWNVIHVILSRPLNPLETGGAVSARHGGPEEIWPGAAAAAGGRGRRPGGRVGEDRPPGEEQRAAGESSSFPSSYASSALKGALITS